LDFGCECQRHRSSLCGSADPLQIEYNRPQNIPQPSQGAGSVGHERCNERWYQRGNRRGETGQRFYLAADAEW
jgi:hypothetical protein